MSALKPGWPNRVHKYLKLQVEPVTSKKVTAEALGLDASLLTKGEYAALARVIASAGWRSQTFWCPHAHDGPWDEGVAPNASPSLYTTNTARADLLARMRVAVAGKPKVKLESIASHISGMAWNKLTQAERRVAAGCLARLGFTPGEDRRWRRAEAEAVA
jgi:hypothetical protein